MTIAEKVSYIKGLVEGLGLPEDKDEVRVLREIIGALELVASDISGLDDRLKAVDREVEAMSEDVESLEEVTYGDLEDGEDDEDDEDGEDDEDFYEVACPACHEKVYIDSGVLEEGKIACPSCGEAIEFECGSCDDDCCGCGDDHDDHGEDE